MKYQYESEILFRLMERDGFNIPSSVPPYESEIKAYLIDQVKQAYPKLTDYEAEWLLYNYTKHLPADFPISSVSNVTGASFENVVPFAYQSAILKGNTLVNIFAQATKGYHLNATNNGKKGFTMTGDGTATCHSWWDLDLSTTKQYILIFVINTNTLDQGFVIKGNDEQKITDFPTGTIGKQKVIFTPTAPDIRFKVEGKVNGTIIVDNIMIVEYQEGMENWDIPYFEGMQTVKMPVLTTTGKNLIGNLVYGTVRSNGIIADNKGHQRVRTDYIPISSTGAYRLSNHSDEIGTAIIFSFDENKKLVRNAGWKGSHFDSQHTFSNEEKYMIIEMTRDLTQTDDIDITKVKIQFEQNTLATTYEPFKSNVLTVNEEVTLRSNGNVRDELDMLTGKLTQRIDEDGSVLTQEVVKTVE